MNLSKKPENIIWNLSEIQYQKLQIFVEGKERKINLYIL